MSSRQLALRRLIAVWLYPCSTNSRTKILTLSTNLLRLFPWRNLQRLAISIAVAIVLILFMKLVNLWLSDGGVQVLVARVFRNDDTVLATKFNQRDYDSAQALYRKHLKLNKVCIKHSCTLASNVTDDNSDNDGAITVVTAYLNLGTFKKGNTSKTYTTGLYYTWGKAISLVQNDMILFTDDENFLKESKALRDAAGFQTCFCFVKRLNLLSFRLVPKISKILKQPGYPKHHPNTVVPEYGATMHAKYDVMQLSLGWNPFNTTYFTWMDVGIFRDLVNYTLTDTSKDEQILTKIFPEPFYLDTPPNWDRKRVAVNQVSDVLYNMSVKDYFMENSVWIGGGFFMATREVMHLWIQQYRRALSTLLAMGLSNTDQQVLYAMFHPSMMKNLHIHPDPSSIVYPQYYRKQKDDKINEWFYLPFLCRKHWYTRVNKIECKPTFLDLNECFKLANSSSVVRFSLCLKIFFLSLCLMFLKLFNV